MSTVIHSGDWIEVLRTLPDESVQCCVTSPPYWGLRDYGVAGQLGLERTPEEYVAKMVEGFREVRRVLRKDGTCWINLGDSYNGSGKGGVFSDASAKQATNHGANIDRPTRLQSCKAKDLVGIPWMVAFALRSDGWYLRQDIIWSKPNPMPESVRDRCTKSHEYIFLLSKSERYYYDSGAIAEPVLASSVERQQSGWHGETGRGYPNGRQHNMDKWMGEASAEHTERNKRSVWSLVTKGYSEAHFATFPPEIPETCIKAGTKEGDTVLDPFNGAGTTGLVATRLNRNYIGIELNPEYVEMATRRIVNDAPMFNSVTNL